MKKLFLLLVVMFFCNVVKPSEMCIESRVCVSSIQQSDWDIMYANIKESYRTILERFCYDFYYANFGRYYKPGSIYVSDIKIDEHTFTIFITGTHTYYGKSYGFGRKEHQGVPFIVTLSVLQSGIRVIFQKWYEPDLLYPNGRWEAIDKIVPFSY